MARGNWKHGHARRGMRSPEHTVWLSMLTRCGNPKSKTYAKYGAVGIKVCDAWRDSFEQFLADVGPRPSLKHSIDRFPNPNGNYEPGNVRWATGSEQSRNRKSNRLLTFRGVTKTMIEWAEEVGLRKDTLKQRLKMGWSVETALTTPLLKKWNPRQKRV